MDDSDTWEGYQARQVLSAFAADLHDNCQLEPVTFFPPFLRKGFHIDAVEMAGQGLNLELHDYGPYFIEMERIGKNTFYRKHGHVVWVIPPWL